MLETPDAQAVNKPRRSSGRRDDRLLRLFISNALAGAVIGWAFLTAILHFDVAQLRTLISASPSGPLALFMLAMVFALTFGAASIGTAIFLLPPDEPREKGVPPRIEAPILRERAPALVRSGRAIRR